MVVQASSDELETTDLIEIPFKEKGDQMIIVAAIPQWSSF